jgi:hypothetical protein
VPKVMISQCENVPWLPLRLFQRHVIRISLAYARITSFYISPRRLLTLVLDARATAFPINEEEETAKNRKTDEETGNNASNYLVYASILVVVVRLCVGV